MSTGYFNPPTPAYNNPPINPQYYAPSRFVISAITRGIQTTVTTSVNHNYVLGQLVRMVITPNYGIPQINEELGYVTTIPSADEVTLDIDSSLYDAFIPSPAYGPTPPQIVAVGDSGIGLVSSTGRNNPTTTIPGSFINISPN